MNSLPVNIVKEHMLEHSEYTFNFLRLAKQSHQQRNCTEKNLQVCHELFLILVAGPIIMFLFFFEQSSFLVTDEPILEKDNEKNVTMVLIVMVSMYRKCL